MCDNQRPLLGKVVIDVGDDLNGHISFPRSRWSDNLKKKAEKTKVREEIDFFVVVVLFYRLRKMGDARSEVRSGHNTKALGLEED